MYSGKIRAHGITATNSYIGLYVSLSFCVFFMCHIDSQCVIGFDWNVCTPIELRNFVNLWEMLCLSKKKCKYKGHTFYVTEDGKPKEELYRFTVKANEYMYVVPPENENSDHYQFILQERKFMDEYLERTGRPVMFSYLFVLSLGFFLFDFIFVVNKIKSSKKKIANVRKTMAPL